MLLSVYDHNDAFKLSDTINNTAKRVSRQQHTYASRNNYHCSRPVSYLLNTAGILVTVTLTIIIFTQEKTSVCTAESPIIIVIHPQLCSVGIWNKFVQALRRNRLFRYAFFLVMWFMALNASTIGMVDRIMFPKYCCSILLIG